MNERVVVDGVEVEVEVELVGRGPGVTLLGGGAATSHGYFPGLAQALSGRARVLTHDRPGVGRARDGRQLRLEESAAQVAEAVRATGGEPQVVVGHSLGALVALRLALDSPDLVSALVLLDPTPVFPAKVVRASATSLRLLAALGPVGRGLWAAAARKEVKGLTLDADQQTAFAVYTDPTSAKDTGRWAAHLAAGSQQLADDLAAGGLADLPGVVVSAGHKPSSPVRTAHQQLADWMPRSRLVVWEGTSHALHLQRPADVPPLVLALLSP